MKSVYVISASEGVVKVGVAENAYRRLSQLQTSSPTRMELAFHAAVSGDAYVLERRAHAALESHRLVGEWFACAAAEAILVITMCAATRGYALSQLPLRPQLARVAKSRKSRPLRTIRLAKWRAILTAPEVVRIQEIDREIADIMNGRIERQLIANRAIQRARYAERTKAKNPPAELKRREGKRK